MPPKPYASRPASRRQQAPSLPQKEGQWPQCLLQLSQQLRREGGGGDDGDSDGGGDSDGERAYMSLPPRRTVDERPALPRAMASGGTAARVLVDEDKLTASELMELLCVTSAGASTGETAIVGALPRPMCVFPVQTRSSFPCEIVQVSEIVTHQVPMLKHVYVHTNR